MTHDKLQTQLEDILDGVVDDAYRGGSGSVHEIANRIRALFPPQPKLEWREHDEWGAAYFHIGDLRIGEIRKDGGVWHAWAGGFRYGFYEDRDAAKRAVEEAVRKALGWAE